LEVIVAFLGPPSQAQIAAMESEDAQSMIANLSFSKPRKTLEEKMDSAPLDAIDLVRQMIAFNPADRPTAEQALRHSYVAQFHSRHKEIVAESIVEMALDDSVKHSVKDYRSQIYRETQPSAEIWAKRPSNARMRQTAHLRTASRGTAEFESSKHKSMLVGIN
jgi:mitogen-activated protein kinase 15